MKNDKFDKNVKSKPAVRISSSMLPEMEDNLFFERIKLIQYPIKFNASLSGRKYSS